MWLFASLIPWPSLSQVFDHLLYAKTVLYAASDLKSELGMRLAFYHYSAMILLWFFHDFL